MKPGVTLSMIVRDEEAVLARCLNSVAEHVDAIVIVDTGSTDATIEIAEDFGAKVESIEWPQAFDVARNFSFAQVRTQWTFWMDADEWLMPGCGPMLRHASKQWSASGYFVRRTDFQDGSPSGSVDLLRLWRTHPEMRVTGVLHESFLPEVLEAASGGRQLEASPIALGHDGYSNETGRAAKMQRNIDLLRRSLIERGETFYHRSHLAIALCSAKESEGMDRLRELCREILSTWPALAGQTMSPVVIGHWLVRADDDAIRSDFATRLIGIVSEAFPFSPTAMWEVYRAHRRRNEDLAAMTTIEALRRLGKGGGFETLNPIHPRFFEFVEEEWKALGANR